MFCKSGTFCFAAYSVIGYMKRISNFSQARQKEAAQRYYAPLR